MFVERDRGLVVPHKAKLPRADWLRGSSSATALVLAFLPAPGLAATTVSTDTSTALATSSGGDITVTEDGSITLASGSAITVDSNAAVTVEGAIAVDDADGAIGISVNSGTTATITTGDESTIFVTEDYVPDDADSNAVADGPIAEASGRYGIHVAGDAAGSITTTGSIKVEGVNSGGIVLGGSYTGSLKNTGIITVIGDNSTAISAEAVDGDVTVEGTVTAIGAGARGVAVNGDVTGTVTIQGTVTQAASYTDDDSATVYLSRAALRNSAPAVSISGNVAGGILVAVPPTDNDSKDTDEDDDGVTDAEEGTGSVVSYGNGPAMLVGGTADTTIGAVTGRDGTHSIVIDGSVAGNSYYSRTDAYGLVIGGQGGNVTLTDGIGVTGVLRATTYDASATALLINRGSHVDSLYNTGSILAGISSPGEGSVVAIRDLSGTLRTIENSGYITASGSSTDTRIAIDLSANTSGVTINQYLNDDDAEASADYLDDNDVDVDPTIYTKITGDILLGTGADTISASAGQIAGDTYYGAGNDVLALSGDAAYAGTVYFGAGLGTATMADSSSFTGTIDPGGNVGTLTLFDTAAYTGDFANAGNLTVNVVGGTLTASEDAIAQFGTLNIGAGGTLGVYINGDENSSFDVQTATLADGASITATVSNLAEAEGTFTVLTAGTLDIQGGLNSSLDLPFIYSGTVSNDAEHIYLTLARKTGTELGLTRSASAAWDAVYATAMNDDSLSASLLDVADTETLQGQVSALLPDHSGGVFDAVTRADRLAAHHLSDETSRFDISDVGGWLEPVFWRGSRDAGDSAGYKTTGWGMSAGVEQRTALGYFGLSYAWLHGKVTDNGGTGEVSLSQHDFGAFWRTDKGPFMAWARLAGSRIAAQSDRTFTGTIDDIDFTYTASGKWKGWLLSGLAGASYRYEVSRRFSLKPKVELSQTWLKEDGYDETADSDAIALSVAGRTSKLLTATPTLSAAYAFGPLSRDWHPLTVQLEAGRREVLSGRSGSTTALFSGGDSYDAGEAFTLAGNAMKGAWVGEASLLAGGYDFTWKLTSRVERAASGTDLSARASLSVAF